MELGSLAFLEIRQRRPLATIRLRRDERTRRNHEASLNAERSAQREREAREVVDRIGALNVVHARGVALTKQSPLAEDDVDSWQVEALGGLHKGERWTVLHA